MINTRELVIGQEVSMRNGPYGDQGTVVRITPKSIEVRVEHSDSGESGMYYFDSEGKSFQGSFEGGFWELYEPPVYSRVKAHIKAALNKEAERRGKCMSYKESFEFIEKEFGHDEAALWDRSID